MGGALMPGQVEGFPIILTLSLSKGEGVYPISLTMGGRPSVLFPWTMSQPRVRRPAIEDRGDVLRELRPSRKSAAKITRAVSHNQQRATNTACFQR